MDKSSGKITSEPHAPREDQRLARLAELDRQIAARAAVLEAQAGSDRAKFLRLLRSDRALEEMKLEHDRHQLLMSRRASKLSLEGWSAKHPFDSLEYTRDQHAICSVNNSQDWPLDGLAIRGMPVQIESAGITLEG